VPITLADQLMSLGMTPADVTFVAFSHFHFDHTGNANLFAQSTWIVNQNELNWGLSAPKDSGVATDTWSAYKTAKIVMITGDHDVFGDGKVRILKAPGHTPGHQVLELRLNKTSTIPRSSTRCQSCRLIWTEPIARELHAFPIDGRLVVLPTDPKDRVPRHGST
jgi:N-acyl homoserine lactone hydrolase